MNDHTAITAKVSILEARARVADECVAQEEFIKDTSIQEAMKWVMDNFQ